jgi:pyruvate-formate lyase-activating enzyme
MASPLSSANISCINCHNPSLKEMKESFVYSWKMGHRSGCHVSGAVVREKAMHSVNQKIRF